MRLAPKKKSPNQINSGLKYKIEALLPCVKKTVSLRSIFTYFLTCSKQQ